MEEDGSWRVLKTYSTAHVGKPGRFLRVSLAVSQARFPLRFPSEPELELFTPPSPRLARGSARNSTGFRKPGESRRSGPDYVRTRRGAVRNAKS